MRNRSEDTGRTPIHLSVVVCALLVAGSAAWGEAPVTIANAGFEDPVLADGDRTWYATGWDAFEGGDIGVWNVEVGDFPAEAREGSNVARIHGATTVQGPTQVLTGATGRFEFDAIHRWSSTTS